MYKKQIHFHGSFNKTCRFIWLFCRSGCNCYLDLFKIACNLLMYCVLLHYLERLCIAKRLDNRLFMAYLYFIKQGCVNPLAKRGRQSPPGK
jgi:hypothetical protein